MSAIGVRPTLATPTYFGLGYYAKATTLNSFLSSHQYKYSSINPSSQESSKVLKLFFISYEVLFNRLIRYELGLKLRHLGRSQVDKAENKVAKLRAIEVLSRGLLDKIGHDMTSVVGIRPTFATTELLGARLTH